MYLLKFTSTSYVDKIFISTMSCGHLFISPNFPNKNIYFQKTPAPPPHILMAAPYWINISLYLKMWFLLRCGSQGPVHLHIMSGTGIQITVCQICEQHYQVITVAPEGRWQWQWKALFLKLNQKCFSYFPINKVYSINVPWCDRYLQVIVEEI